MFPIYQKTFILIAIITSLISCSNDIFDNNQDNLGKVLFYNSLDKKSFSFTVSDSLPTNNKMDNKHPLMTKSQATLLKHLLKKNNYCINSKNKLKFEVTSKQQKIYDVTFSGLIEQQYNAKSLTPVTYFGKCL